MFKQSVISGIFLGFFVLLSACGNPLGPVEESSMSAYDLERQESANRIEELKRQFDEVEGRLRRLGCWRDYAISFGSNWDGKSLQCVRSADEGTSLTQVDALSSFAAFCDKLEDYEDEARNHSSWERLPSTGVGQDECRWKNAAERAIREILSRIATAAQEPTAE